MWNVTASELLIGAGVLHTDSLDDSSAALTSWFVRHREEPGVQVQVQVGSQPGTFIGD